MSIDPQARAAERALKAYCNARRPPAELELALVDAILRLIAARSGLVVTMRVGDGQITRGVRNPA